VLSSRAENTGHLDSGSTPDDTADTHEHSHQLSTVVMTRSAGKEGNLRAQLNVAGLLAFSVCIGSPHDAVHDARWCNLLGNHAVRRGCSNDAAHAPCNPNPSHVVSAIMPLAHESQGRFSQTLERHGDRCVDVNAAGCCPLLQRCQPGKHHTAPAPRNILLLTAVHVHAPHWRFTTRCPGVG
jgi:hypothetical protein